jgi:energy-coupling factor transporter ATP-binding protein EcfA2
MDTGAHFHCCDLQVHSPRDNNWVGECPVTEEERRSYAAEFISACRQKGLEAVAITDHHDLAMFPYFRLAAMTETDDKGQHIPAALQIIIFPGIELTLAVPCQAILLFDPEVHDDDLQRAMASLGITPDPAENAKAHSPVQRLLINDLNEVYRRLEEHQSIKDRFILLPNLNDGGEDTVLRPGFYECYKNMRCVGGYVDGTCHMHGKRLIVDGKDPAWGNKRVGLIQTSDSRRRDFSSLAEHPTWIKWSIPSAEGLRQACLAPESRLRYSPPALPDNSISKVEVTNSKYFGPLVVEFNPQFNAIIGGRGSGKSTILEYLRWALCDQPYVHHEDEASELPDFEKRRRSLIAATLRQWEGTVLVHYTRNGVPHRIRREGTTGKVYLKVADQGESEATEETIQSLAQIQGYSQKQLSHVSVRARELKRLLKSPIAQDLATNKSQLEAAISDLRQAFERNESRRNLQAQVHAIGLDLTSKREQIRSLTEEMRNLPEEHRAAIDGHPQFAEGVRLAANYSATIASATKTIRTADEDLKKLVNDLPEVRTARPPGSLNAVRGRLEGEIRGVIAKLGDIITSLDRLTADLAAEFAAARSEFESHRAQYEAAASENATIQQRLESLRALSDQATLIESERVRLEHRLSEIRDSEAQLVAARQQWRVAVERESDLLEVQAVKLTGDSSGELRVSIDRGKGTDGLKTALVDSVRGAGITTPEKFDNLVSEIGRSPDPIGAWVEAAEELVVLARIGSQLATGTELPATPKLVASGFIASELRRIATRMTPVNGFELTLLFPECVPIFEYRTVGGAYIPFEQASPGQQATALIGLLLNQTAGPLVVDQPEDDLDMSTILRVAEHLWKAKEKRQVIFATHNPNLVVVGDAELVLNCAYTHPGQTASVHISHDGAIDNPTICNVITEVMEGGEQAFRLRKERYGF